jgi:hypothetical protein
MADRGQGREVRGEGSALRVLSLYILHYDDATGSAADHGTAPLLIRVQYDREPGEQPAD